MNIYTERVAKGKALLDAFDPDWVEKVNWERLRMVSTRDCVLGQLFTDAESDLDYMEIPGYRTGLKALGLTEDGECSSAHCSSAHCSGGHFTAEGFGFSTSTSGGDAWRELEEAWKAAVGKSTASQ